MAELDKTISVIESWLKQPVLTPPPINDLYDALELLKEQKDIGTELTNAVELIHKKNERIEKLLKEQEAKPVEVCVQAFTIKYGHCPKCGKGMDSDAYPHWCGFCGQEVKWNE